MFRRISYTLHPDDAVWPGNAPAVGTQSFSAIRQGGNSNKTLLHLFSHSGTHLDAPRHFNDRGPCAFELPIENFIFSAPLLIDVPRPAGGAIGVDDLDPYAERLAEADLALLRTGWSDQRYSNPRRYALEGPYLHPDGAALLMTYPNLKGVAIDAISIGTPGQPEAGRVTHQILLGTHREDDRFLLILEDFRIDADLGDALRLYAWPLMIEGSDGSPCTIVAEFAEPSL